MSCACFFLCGVMWIYNRIHKINIISTLKERQYSMRVFPLSLVLSLAQLPIFYSRWTEHIRVVQLAGLLHLTPKTLLLLAAAGLFLSTAVVFSILLILYAQDISGPAFRIQMAVPNRNKGSAVLFGAAIFLLTYVITYRQMPYPDISDFALHTAWSMDLPVNLPFKLTYPLWHILVFLVYQISALITPEIACATVTAAVNLVVYLIFLRQLRKENILFSSAIALTLCINTAIYCPWYDERIYLGQGSPVTWHNPTNLVVKPFAIIAFFMIADMLTDILADRKVEGKRMVVLSLLLVCSVLAKPSFFQGIVPGLGLYILVLLIKNKGKHFLAFFFLCMTFVPAFIIVVAQFVLSFYSNSGSGGEGIGIGWLVVNYSPNVLFSLFLLLCFPLLYTVLNWSAARKDTALVLSWLYWVMAWLEKAVLYEKGERMYHGNFGWAVLVADTILFLVTALHYFRDVHSDITDHQMLSKKNAMIGMVYLLHFFSGCIYAYQMLVNYNGWWL